MFESPFWHQLLIALALVFVIEGVFPFLSPRAWRETMARILPMSDRAIRTGALVSMIFGTVLLYWLKH